MSREKMASNVFYGAILLVAFASTALAASSSDITIARRFLSQLPPACANSRMGSTSDGAVIIWIKCKGNGKSTSGIVKIKDGVVTTIR